MNRNKGFAKGLITGALLTILLTSSVAVLANTALLEVVFSVNHVVVNGNRLNLSEEERPFTSGGRTFLPARAISEALGYPVEWDGNTATIYIGSRTNTSLGVMPHPSPQPQNESPSLSEILSRIEGTWVDRNYFYADSIENWNTSALIISFSEYGVHYDVGIGRWPLTISHHDDGLVELIHNNSYTGEVVMRFIVNTQTTDIQEIRYYGGFDRLVLIPYREPSARFAAERTNYGVLLKALSPTIDDYFYIYRSTVEGERGIRIYDGSNFIEGVEWVYRVGITDFSISETGTYYYSAWTPDGAYFPTATGWQVRVP
ncbi:MAG: copper amine oxidase N-terminal domain-containing protein [Defluviitaleaceae bacterium]|nr:copper amine oxidase N-terminal domain-containing protein [Defluviitaleaceae bacterium]